ncbi:MAG: urease accessory protein UreD [Candidatus Contendobacter sp.]|nr:urease accessory protein UreD [Candidatus Contendobacter sp.]MDS4060214.1 urease accessory protein UreD [Candidatus Contendobacter sp.]
MTLAAATSPTGWLAQLTLDFQCRNTRTVLERRSHQGPLQVQRPFYPEGESVCHVALLHPPGGVVGGDELRIDASLGRGAHALVTTPAAGKFYRSAGSFARQAQLLTVAPSATLEWLPQENILYSGARVHALTHVELQGDARFLGWEIFCLGRPAAGETFEAGEYRQDFELWRDGEPLYLEQGRYVSGDPVLDAPWGLRGQPVSATLICTDSPLDLVGAIRSGWDELKPPSRTLPGLPASDSELATASQLDGVLICRYLGPSTARARRFFTLAWGLLRPALFGRPPCPSRFWNI